MRKSLKNIEEGSNQINKIVHLSYQLCLASFKSILQGIIKRVECQALCRIIVQSNTYNKRTHKLKFMQYISQRSLKDKKQQVFNRIRQSGQQQKVREKAVKNLALIVKRITKEKFSKVLIKLKGKDIETYSRIQDNKKSRQSIKSGGRQSQSSNLLEVSQSSILSSRILHFQESKEHSRQDIMTLRTENEELKRMALSEEVKQSLFKMQRFGRLSYSIESQKILKEPVTVQLRRFERMKNEFREMRSKYYDNQLTMTCLFNHMKIISEMNKDIGDINSLKTKIIQLDKKLADANTLHRKQISQYKKKLLFLDSGNKNKPPQRENITDSRTSIEENVISYEFSNEQQTTYNILVTALKEKSYVDIRREIEHFLKISSKEQFTTVFKEFSGLVNHVQMIQKQKNSAEKTKTEVLNSLNLFDKHLRGEKLEQMQRLKNRCKAQSPLEITQLFQSVISSFQQLRKIRKRQASSTEKQKKGNQNDLQAEKKKLQIRIKQLEQQKQKLNENLKKSRLSLLPRRKSDKESEQELRPQSLKKVQQQVERLTRQKEDLMKSRKIAEENASKKSTQLQEELNKSKIQIKECKIKLKQFEDGIKYSTIIRQKKDAKKVFTREVNEFKRIYPSSIFTDYLIRIQTEQSDKRKYQLLQTQKAKVDQQVITKQSQLSKVKEQNESIIQQLQEKITSYEETLSKLKKQAESNPKTPSKPPKQSNQKWEQIIKENERLRSQVQSLQSRAAQSPITYRSPIMQLSSSKSSASKNQEAMEKAKQLEDFLRYYEEIKRKKLRKMEYSKQLQELKMDYPDSTLTQILQSLLSLEKHYENLARERQEAFSNQITQLKFQLEQQSHLSVKNEQLLFQIQQVNHQILYSQSKINEYETKLLQQKKANEQVKKEIEQSKIKYEHKCFQLAQSRTQIDILQDSLDKSKAELILLKRRKSLSPTKEQTRIQRSNSEKNEAYRNKLAACEEKLANYKILFDKIKGQRDNMNLLLEEKNEQYENCKESLEKYEQIHKNNQSKIDSLQASIATTEAEFRKLEKQAQKLLHDRDAILVERKSQQNHYNGIIRSKEAQIQRMKLYCEDKDRRYTSLQYQLEQSKRKSEIDMAHLHQQRNYLCKNLEIAEQEIARIRAIHEQQIRQYRNKCERSNLQINEYRQNVQLQRQLLRQKVSQFTRITQSATSTHLLQDHQKAQLRRQLDLLNSQLANIIRNNQNELRESRRYIEQLINEAQSRGVLHNEQKRILKEEIERARNEEYEINQQKIKQLREDIQDLRQQNDRLISIIDSNEAPFHKLVQEHKDMHQGVIELQETNGYLEQENASIREENNELAERLKREEQEKRELSEELEKLEGKLGNFELRIVAAMNQGLMKQEITMKQNKERIEYLQSIISGIRQQNNCLNTRKNQQAQEIMKLHGELIRLQMQLNRQRNNLQRSSHQTIQSKSNEYSQYLEEQLKIKQTQIKQSHEKEGQMVMRIEELMRAINELEGEKQFILSHLQQQEIQYNARYTNWQTDVTYLQQKIMHQEEIISIKEEQLSRISMTLHQVQQNKIETTTNESQTDRLRLQSQISQLSYNLQEEHNKRILLEQRLQQLAKLTLENKRLVNKISILQEDARQFKNIMSQSSNQITFLQSQLQITSSKPQLQLEKSAVPSVQKILREEIDWLRKELEHRNEELSKYRSDSLQLHAELSKLQEMSQQNEARYHRESQLLEQAKSKIRKLELAVANHQYSKQKAQQNFSYQTLQKDRQISLLTEAMQQLKSKYESTKAKFHSQSKIQNDFLLQIARKLDQNYHLSGKEERMEINILKKISQEIGELIEMNHRYRQKCEFMESEGYQLRMEEVQSRIASSLRIMFIELLSFLKSNEFINPQQVPSLPEGGQVDKIIIELGFLLRDLFSSFLKTNEDEIIKYNNIIRDIRAMLDEACLTNNLHCLTNLRQLLLDAQQ